MFESQVAVGVHPARSGGTAPNQWSVLAGKDSFEGVDRQLPPTIHSFECRGGGTHGSASGSSRCVVISGTRNQRETGLRAPVLTRRNPRERRVRQRLLAACLVCA